MQASYLLAHADLRVLETHCRAHKLKFPMLVARLALLVASGSAQPDALEPLCFANVGSPPPDDWAHEHALLLAGLGRGGAFTHPQLACACGCQAPRNASSPLALVARAVPDG